MGQTVSPSEPLDSKTRILHSTAMNFCRSCILASARRATLVLSHP